MVGELQCLMLYLKLELDYGSHFLEILKHWIHFWTQHISSGGSRGVSGVSGN